MRYQVTKCLRRAFNPFPIFNRKRGDYCLLEAVKSQAIRKQIAIWRVSLNGYPQETYYFLVIGIALLLVEMVYTIGVRHGREYKWYVYAIIYFVNCVFVKGFAFSEADPFQGGGPGFWTLLLKLAEQKVVRKVRFLFFCYFSVFFPLPPPHTLLEEA